MLSGIPDPGVINPAISNLKFQIYEAELDSDKNLANHAQRKEFIISKYSNLTFTSSKYHDIIVESS